MSTTLNQPQHPDKVIFDLQLAFTRYGWMYYTPSDLYIGRALREYGEYSYIEAEVLRTLTRGKVFIDVGANLGAHSIAVASTGARCLAIEPQPLYAKLIVCSAILNNYKIRALEGMCSDVPGEMQRNSPTYKEPLNYGCFGLGNGIAAGKGLRVYTLDELVELNEISECTMFKIDVEGHELQVLRGAERLLATQHPCIMVEADREEHVPELVEFLEARDYTPYWYINFLYNPENYYTNPTNLYGNECSINLLGLWGEGHPISGLVRAHATDKIQDPESPKRIVASIGRPPATP